MENDQHSESTAPLLPQTAESTSLEINDGPSRHSRQVPFFILLLVPILILIPLLFLLAVLLPRHEPAADAGGGDRGPPMGREPAVATVMQFVTEDGSYVDPRESELYHQLRNGAFRTAPVVDKEGTSYATTLDEGDGSNTALYKLEVSHESVSFGDEVQLSWSQEHSNNEMDEEIILALSCTQEDDTTAMDIAKNLVDAATLAQVKATHAHHNRVESESNKWIIPSFPILRFNHCQFTMLQPTQLQHTQNEVQYYNILATSQINLGSSQEVPTSIHLGLSSDPNARYIQFTTGIPGGSVVEIAKRGSTDEELTFVKLTGVSTTYGAGDMCDSPANSVEAGGFVNPGHLHTVKAEGLEVGAEYGECGVVYGTV